MKTAGAVSGQVRMPVVITQSVRAQGEDVLQIQLIKYPEINHMYSIYHFFYYRHSFVFLLEKCLKKRQKLQKTRVSSVLLLSVRLHARPNISRCSNSCLTFWLNKEPKMVKRRQPLVKL